MEADDRDRAPHHAVCGEEGLDRLGVHVGHQLLGLGERLGPIGVSLEADGGGHRAPQHLALLIAVGPVAGRPHCSISSPSVSTSATSTPS